MKGSIVPKKVAGKTRYYVVVDLPRKKGEKRKQKWFPAGTSYRHAEEILPSCVLKVKNTNFGHEIRFCEIADNYLFRVQPTLAASTYKNYAAITDCGNR